MSMRLWILVVAGALAGCGAASDDVGESTDDVVSNAKSKRFNANHPAPVQTDDWSCSVHTTTWMLQATGHDVTHADVSSKMRGAGRVSPAVGLTDASGSGLAQTLRDMATGSPEVGSTPSASFDEVADRAGKMALGIGGRGWYHWSAVRGYDRERDVILLANSAPNWKGAGQDLTRDEFRSLGAFSMVWMDYGSEPEEPPAPFEVTLKPAEGAFPALLIKTGVEQNNFITQCNESGDAERVWQTDGSGPNPEARWAIGKYPELAEKGCGEPRDGVHPLVFRNMIAGEATKVGKEGPSWTVEQCTDEMTGRARIYKLDLSADVDGHPVAAFVEEKELDACR